MPGAPLKIAILGEMTTTAVCCEQLHCLPERRPLYRVLDQQFLRYVQRRPALRHGRSRGLLLPSAAENDCVRPSCFIEPDRHGASVRQTPGSDLVWLVCFYFAFDEACLTVEMDDWSCSSNLPRFGKCTVRGESAVFFTQTSS